MLHYFTLCCVVSSSYIAFFSSYLSVDMPLWAVCQAVTCNDNISYWIFYHMILKDSNTWSNLTPRDGLIISNTSNSQHVCPMKTTFGKTADLVFIHSQYCSLQDVNEPQLKQPSRWAHISRAEHAEHEFALTKENITSIICRVGLHKTSNKCLRCY